MIIINFKALKKKKPPVSWASFIIYKIEYVMHFVISIVSYLALIRLLFVELGVFQIKRKYYTTILLYLSTASLTR